MFWAGLCDLWLSAWDQPDCDNFGPWANRSLNHILKLVVAAKVAVLGRAMRYTLHIGYLLKKQNPFLGGLSFSCLTLLAQDNIRRSLSSLLASVHLSICGRQSRNRASHLTCLLKFVPPQVLNGKDHHLLWKTSPKHLWLRYPNEAFRFWIALPYLFLFVIARLEDPIFFFFFSFLFPPWRFALTFLTFARSLTFSSLGLQHLWSTWWGQGQGLWIGNELGLWWVQSPTSEGKFTTNYWQFKENFCTKSEEKIESVWSNFTVFCSWKNYHFYHPTFLYIHKNALGII